MSKWILGHYGISSSAEKAFHFRNTVLVLIKLGHKFRPVLYLWIWIFPLLEVKSWTFKKTQLPQARAATDASCREGGKACLRAGCLVHRAGTASESWRGSRENLTKRARHAGWWGGVWEARKGPSWNNQLWRPERSWWVRRSCLSLLSLPTNLLMVMDCYSTTEL